MQPLIVDVFQGDLGGVPNWPALVALGAPWHGAILKATEGTYYSPAWFAGNWRSVRTAAGDRYGQDFFRGAYHFLKFNQSGTLQADYYLKAITDAGGFAIGDLWPIVDVELGGEKNSNQTASAQQIIDCTSAFADRVKKVTGRKIVLYGAGAMFERGITSRMHCDYLWCPRYTPTLPKEVYERIGWTLDALLMWQYSGDGQSYLAGYPSYPPGFGKCDVSALVAGSQGAELAWLRAELWAETPNG